MENVRTIRQGAAQGPQPANRQLTLARIIRENSVLVAIVLLASVIRAFAVEAKPYEWDLFMFRDWTVIIHDQGIGAVLHAPMQDYIGYHFVLWLIGHVYTAFAGPDWAREYLLLHVLKIPGAVADVGVLVLVYFVARTFFLRNPSLIPARLVRLTQRLPGFGRAPATDVALVACAIYAFNPGVTYAASYWGQLDSVPTFFMLAALAVMLDRRYALAWALLAVGFFLKPQAVIIVPLLGLISLKQIGFWPSVRAGLAGASVLIPCYAYFVAIGEIDTVYRIYQGIFLDTTTKISTSAWNLWWPFRLESLPDPNAPFLSLGPLGVTYTLASQALTVLSGLLALAYTWRSRSPAAPFIAACFLAFSFFMLPMKIHERYLFPFFAFGAPLVLQNRRLALLYAVLTVTYTTNLMGVYHTLWTEFFRHDTTAIVCSYVNIVCYVFFAAYLFKDTLGDWLRQERRVADTERGGIAPASSS